MSQNTHKLALSTSGWDQNPICWRNFVEWVIQKHGLNHPGDDLWHFLEMELTRYNLEVDMMALYGDPQDLTAWMLAHA
jgi:hypothetical protein